MYVIDPYTGEFLGEEVICGPMVNSPPPQEQEASPVVSSPPPQEQEASPVVSSPPPKEQEACEIMYVIDPDTGEFLGEELVCPLPLENITPIST